MKRDVLGVTRFSWFAGVATGAKSTAVVPIAMRVAAGLVVAATLVIKRALRVVRTIAIGRARTAVGGVPRLRV